MNNRVKMAAFCVALGGLIKPAMNADEMESVIGDFCHMIDGIEMKIKTEKL